MTRIKNHTIYKIIFSLGDILSRQCVYKWFQYYQTTQWLHAAQLKNIQDDNLSILLNKSYNEVKMYNLLFNKYGFKQREKYTIEDLSTLPIITKETLKNNFPEGCCRDTNRPTQKMFTSGSSGQPFCVKIDNHTLSHARALMLLRATYSGWYPGEPFLQTGMSVDRGFVKKVKDIVLSTSYVSSFDLSDEKLDKYLQIIDEKKINYLMGYPASMFYLAVYADKVSFNRRLRGIVTWGDNLYGQYRTKIEQVFGCQVTDTYGCGEGIQVGAQCGLNDGAYHIFSPHVIVEIVDNDGNPKPIGEKGNILLTRLQAGAMPLIRYKVGDIGWLSVKDTCPCGRGFHMLGGIEGRDTDVIVTPRGNRLIVHFFTGIFEYYPEIDTFQIEQINKNSILVKIVPGDEFEKNILNEIRREIQEKGDKDLTIEFDILNDIPVSPTGKRRFVISNI